MAPRLLELRGASAGILLEQAQAQHGVDGGDQLLGIEGLGEIDVRPLLRPRTFFSAVTYVADVWMTAMLAVWDGP